MQTNFHRFSTENALAWEGYVRGSLKASRGRYETQERISNSYV